MMAAADFTQCRSSMAVLISPESKAISSVKSTSVIFFDPTLLKPAFPMLKSEP